MQLSISGHHVDVTDALKSYVTGKIEKLERHYHHITNVHVILSVEKLEQKAEATMHISGGELFADANCEDLYAAIDQLSDKLDRQLIKHKEKLGDKRVKQRPTIEEPE
ncbi:MAG: ribosome-associated translation inhibitor RaiA [Pseudomonadales bacterium]